MIAPVDGFYGLFISFLHNKYDDVWSDPFGSQDHVVRAAKLSNEARISYID